jgi:hypothetical protein
LRQGERNGLDDMNGHDDGRLGPTCPACGAPLSRLEAVCPRCHLDQTLPEEIRWGLLTVFGYRLCGLIAGCATAYAGALAWAPPVQRWLVLVPAFCGALGAVAAGEVGRRLLPQWRCAYEHLLLSGAMAGVLAVGLVMLGVRGVESLSLCWLGLGAAGMTLMRRFGYRHGG